MIEIFILIALFVLLVVITVVGHVLWLMGAEVVKWVFKTEMRDEEFVRGSILSTPPPPPRPAAPFSPPPLRADDLTVFERQLARFYEDGKVSDQIYETLMARIRAERAPATTGKTDVVKAVVVPSVPFVSPVEVEVRPEPVKKPFVPPPRTEPPPPPPPPRPPRRPFSEVLNSFMEESNIRWGEIIGGLLI